MNSRNRHILTIVTWSIVAVLLLILLISGINGSLFKPALGPDSNKYSYDEKDFDPESISKIDISWLDGNVKIVGYDGDTIKTSESASRSLSDKNLMECYADGDILVIKYSPAGKFLFSIGKNSFSKALTVKIPRDTAGQIEKLNIDVVSSDINIEGMTAERLYIESTSGEVYICDTEISRLSVDTMSGNLDTENINISDSANIETVSGRALLKGNIASVSTDTVSGAVEIVSNICPKKIKSDSASGDVDIYIPSDSNFTYKFDKLSGEFENEFINQYNENGVVGNGDSEFSFDTISGNVF